jgi:hypothetical protein
VTEVLRNARRIVVKVGSSLVTNEGRGVDAEAIANWCLQLAALARQGRELITTGHRILAKISQASKQLELMGQSASIRCLDSAIILRGIILKFFLREKMIKSKRHHIQ